MTPIEALQFLDSIASQTNGPREFHQRAANAIQLLHALVLKDDAESAATRTPVIPFATTET